MKRWMAFLLMGAMLCPLLGLPAAGVADTLAAAPLMEQSGATDGMIRVWLSSVKSKMTYNVTIDGDYTINGDTSRVVEDGSRIRVEFSGGTVYLTQNGQRVSMGSGFTLKRHSGGDGYNAVKIAETLAPNNYYPCDVQFLYSGGTAYVVCHIYIEDYVYGVLPYEMDNSFPLEALKAQAVAARTYAVRAKTSSGVYDVTDTTTHQVFRGVNYDKTRCIQAVNETWGVVMQYNGSYIGAYYSASNGGQTETNSNIWGSSQLGYLQVKDDPYDLANTASTVKTYLIYSSPQNGSSISAYAMIQSALASRLGGSSSDYTIREITDISLHTPMYPEPSKLYTQMRVSVRYNDGATASVDIPIFPTVETKLNLKINGGDNELYSVEKQTKGFLVSARRYGHGVGMSQRGAQEMANVGYNYAQILGFYYTGVNRVRINFTRSIAGSLQNGTVLPEVTPAPVEDAVGIVQATPATVTLSNTSDRLNLRKEPNTSSAVLARIPHGTQLTVTSSENGWYAVQYGSLSGYVASQYLRLDTQTSAPDTAPGVDSVGTAVVTLNSGTLNLRAEGHATARVIGSLPNGATVAVLDASGTWTRVMYNNQTGYVMSSYLKITLEGSGSSGTTERVATVTLSNRNDILNLRKDPSTSSAVLAKLPHGTELAVVEDGSSWTRVLYQGITGYVMNTYVTFSGQAQSGTDTESGGSSDTPAQTYAATVVLNSGTLNLRAAPNTSSAVLASIPNFAQITVTQLGDSWCGVSYNQINGYVKRSYLSIDLSTDASGGVTSGETAPSDALTADTEVAWAVTQDGGSVNLRRAASTGSTVLVRVPHGAQVMVLEVGTEWTLAAYGGYTGYMATAYLTASAPAGTPSEEIPSGAMGSTCWVSGGNVNLRKDPSLGADVLTTAPAGAEMTLLEMGTEWSKVIYRGLTGYIATGYITFTNGAQSGTGSQNTASGTDDVIRGDAKTTELNNGTLNLNSSSATLMLRAQPSDTADVTGTLKHGERVVVLQYVGSDARWLFLRCGTLEGYALREHVRLDDKLATVRLADADSELSLRAEPSTSANVLDSLHHGDLLTVLDEEDGWAEVVAPDGTEGYVSATYISYL